jgi:hypothetical protein
MLSTKFQEESQVTIPNNHWLTLIAGLLLLFLGGIWALQGVGLLHGSVMTGQSIWLVIGAGAALLGLVLVVWSFRTPPKKA